MKTAQEISQDTGGYINAIPLMDVQGSRDAFNELLGKIQALPFVPSRWSGDVQSAMSASGGLMWQPRPAIEINAWRAGKTAPLYPDLPEWLNDPQAATAWTMIADWWQERMQPILAGWVRSEADVVDAANADATFWNGVYAIVKPVAVVGETILAAPAMVAEAASNVFTGTLRALLPVILILGAVGIAVLVYKHKLAGKPGVMP